MKIAIFMVDIHVEIFTMEDETILFAIFELNLKIIKFKKV